MLPHDLHARELLISTSVPNYKTFWFFKIHSFCCALRYSVCLDTKQKYLEKPKRQYERWRKYMASSHTIVLWQQLGHKRENSDLSHYEELIFKIVITITNSYS